jgi:hypothetical protein
MLFVLEQYNISSIWFNYVDNIYSMTNCANNIYLSDLPLD